MTQAIFEPFTLKSLELKNRIAMAPMARSMSPNAIPGPNVAAYYHARAEGGMGLILAFLLVVTLTFSFKKQSWRKRANRLR